MRKQLLKPNMRRSLSLLVAVVMVFGLLPTTAMAAEVPVYSEEVLRYAIGNAYTDDTQLEIDTTANLEPDAVYDIPESRDIVTEEDSGAVVLTTEVLAAYEYDEPVATGTLSSGVEPNLVYFNANPNSVRTIVRNILKNIWGTGGMLATQGIRGIEIPDVLFELVETPGWREWFEAYRNQNAHAASTLRGATEYQIIMDNGFGVWQNMRVQVAMTERFTIIGNTANFNHRTASVVVLPMTPNQSRLTVLAEQMRHYSGSTRLRSFTMQNASVIVGGTNIGFSARENSTATAYPRTNGNHSNFSYRLFRGNSWHYRSWNLGLNV